MILAKLLNQILLSKIVRNKEIVSVQKKSKSGIEDLIKA